MEVASAVWKSYDYTATSNQTSFSGNDDNSESLSYVAGFVQVFLNGILLDPAVDYTATTGTSIVLTSGATTGDLLQIETFTQIIGTGDILVDTFAVSSTQTAFTLSQDPVNKSNISVYVEGVYQESSTYSLSTTTLTLSESPANGTTVEVVIGTRNVTLDNIADLTISGTLHAGALDLGDANIINVNEISLDTIKGDADANTNITFAGSDVTTFTQGGTERLRLNTTGAEVTGNIVVSGNVDGRDVAADGVTADAALPRAGGAMGGAITTNSTFDGRDVSVDGTKLDTIEVSATADQTDVEIRAAVESASDSNVFTNADHSKLDAIEASATADQTQTEINALGITATGLSGTPNISVGTISSGAITITADGADLIINSVDEELVLLGNRGSTGTNIDAGYLRMKAQGVNKVILDTEGVSSLLGGGLTVGGTILTDGTTSNSVPKYSFSGDTDTGLGYVGTNTVGLIAGGSRKFYVNATNAFFQNLTGGVSVPLLSIGSTTVIDASRNADFKATTITGQGTTSSTYALRVFNGTPTEQMYIRDDGTTVFSGSNYVYITKTAGLYVDQSIKARGGIYNDTAGADLLLNDNVNITGTLSSGAITGTTATASGGTNTTALASTAFVQQEITTLVGGAPGALDTLNELAAAINDEASYAAGITTALGLKAPLASPALTGTVTAASHVQIAGNLDVVGNICIQ